MEDFVGVGVADAADEAWIGEGPLKGAVFLAQGGAESIQIGREDLHAAGIDRVKRILPAHHVKRGAALAPGFGQNQGAVGEVKGGKGVAARELGLRRLPVEAAGDHEVQDQPQIAVHTDGDPFADTAQLADGASFNRGKGRIDGAQQEDRGEAHAFQRLADDARLQCRDVGGDVRQLRHGFQSLTGWRQKRWGQPQLCSNRPDLSNPATLPRIIPALAAGL